MLEIVRPGPSKWSCFHLSGPDAADLLDRISTVDASHLVPGSGMPGLFLSPQGRLEAWFSLWRIGHEDFSVELDPGREDAWKKSFLAFLDRYTFGESYTVSEVDAHPDPERRLECAWLFPGASGGAPHPGLPELGPGQSVATDDEIRLHHHGSRQFGRPWITAWARPARLGQWIERSFPDARESDPETTEAWRIEAARPAADREATRETNPLEIGLADAVAGKKGCYPGQEVIEKILSRGSPPRRLVRIDGPGTPPVPGHRITNLADPPVELGSVTSSARAGDGFQALALIPKIHARADLEVRLAGGPQARIAMVSSHEPD